MNSQDMDGWRKSRYSGALYECVEVKFLPDGVAVRNSRDRGGPVLTFTIPEWETFLAGARAGDFVQAQ